jgi:hypothetical protein
VTSEKVNQGTGLLVDFTDVDGSKANYNTAEPKRICTSWVKTDRKIHFFSIFLL